MQYNKLGKSGAYVSKICLGTMNFGMLTPEDECFRIMDAAIDFGINFFDTSNSYGGYSSRGLTESIIGKWFCQNKKRQQVFLGDKVYHLSEQIFGNPNDEKGLSAYKIRHHVESSLKRLQTDHIDLYQMHHIDRQVSWCELWSEFDRLYDSGKIIYTGSSNFSAFDLGLCHSYAERTNRLGLISEQHRYNLCCRLPELEVIPACRRANIGFLVWGPLNEGKLCREPYRKDSGTRSSHNKFSAREKVSIDTYLNFCKAENIDPSQLALSWLLHNPNITSIIIGPRTYAQLTSCINALEIDVDSYMPSLDEIFPGVGGEAPEAYAW